MTDEEQNLFMFPISGDRKAKIRVPMWSSSGESPLPGCSGRIGEGALGSLFNKNTISVPEGFTLTT